MENRSRRPDSTAAEHTARRAWSKDQADQTQKKQNRGAYRSVAAQDEAQRNGKTQIDEGQTLKKSPAAIAHQWRGQTVICIAKFCLQFRKTAKVHAPMTWGDVDVAELLLFFHCKFLVESAALSISFQSCRALQIRFHSLSHKQNK